MANGRGSAPRDLERLLPERILVADDAADVRELLSDLLTDAGYTVDVANSGNEVLERVIKGTEPKPDLILLDQSFTGSELDGLKTLDALHQQGIDIPAVLVTATRSAETVIKAMQLGAKEYITKPFDLEAVTTTVDRVLRTARSISEGHAAPVPKIEPSERIVGSSPAMVDIFKLIGRVARTSVTVLITGDTGTGKELVAEAIHNASDRRSGPLIKVNCPALPETLLESELFGHEKGAFTSAVTQRKGRFEAANKGTIFLDEISEISLGTQSKLLRVLQEREFERVGSNVPVKVDVRVIAATNRDLWELVDAGRFRQDLYFRLNVIAINMPPLRDRMDDVPALVSHFLNQHRFSIASPPARISEEAMAVLMAHKWPGNVRELEHIIERAVVLSRGELILPEHIYFGDAHAHHAIDIQQRLHAEAPLDDVLEEVRREMIVQALRLYAGDRDKVAAKLRILASVVDAYMDQYEREPVSAS